MRVQNVKPGSQLQQNKRTRKVTRQQELVREGNLVYLNASSRLACQLDEARRQLDRLERHANRMLRSVGAH
jgi:ferric-dicitrate binding protein FerR (iron transport regulator)